MSFNGTAKIEGLDKAMKAMLAAFPQDPKAQRMLLNQAMAQAAKPTITAMAKSLANQTDGSGALAQSIKARAISAARARARGVPASVQIVPDRKDLTAIGMYASFYGAGGGSRAIIDGIRHGHLVEFGFATKNGGFVAARPFMGPALGMTGAYAALFAKLLKKKVEAAVKRKRARR